MKTHVEKAKQEFPPVNLTITFESQQELDVFGCVFNCGRVAYAIRTVIGSDKDMVEPMYEAVLKAGGDIHKYLTKITDAVRN